MTLNLLSIRWLRQEIRLLHKLYSKPGAFMDDSVLSFNYI